MKRKETRADPCSPTRDLHEKNLSRRNFLQTTIAAATVAATVPIAGIAQTDGKEPSSNLKDPLEEILNRYGSEFGELNRVG